MEIIINYINDKKKHNCCIAYRGWNTNNDNFDTFDYDKNGIDKITRNKFNLANSGVGMITHPKFFHKTKDLILNTDIFLNICPTADDLWYYMIRILNEIDTIVIEKNLFHLHYDEKTALFHNFNCNNKNTIIFKKLYTYLKTNNYL